MSSPPNGIAEHVSSLAFAPTVQRLKDAIANAGMTVFASIDHAAGAREVGMEMPPTIVMLYGNPRGGTPIMLAAPHTALDLPLRVLVREAAFCLSQQRHALRAAANPAGAPSVRFRRRLRKALCLQRFL